MDCYCKLATLAAHSFCAMIPAMNDRVKTLIDEARKLTPDERLQLMAELSTVIGDDEPADGTPEEIEAAWAEEVERRIEAVENGQSKLIDFDDAIADAKRRMRRP